MSQSTRIHLVAGAPRAGVALLVGLLATCCRAQGEEAPPPPAPGGEVQAWAPPAGPRPAPAPGAHAMPPVGRRPKPAVAPAPVTSTASATAPAAPVASVRLRDNLRDPFWPAGYLPLVLPGDKVDPVTEAKIGEIEWRAAEKALRETVKGASRIPGKDGTDVYLALVGGRFVPTGAVVSLSLNGKTFRWTVTSVSLKGGPVFERVVPAPKP